MSDMYLDLRTRIPVVTSWVQVGSARLQEAQDSTGLSNERLAREIPVSSKTWERWKKRGEVPASAVPAVARALGIELRRAAAVVVDVPSASDREQRELLDEIRRGFRDVNEKLDMLAELARLAATSRQRR